MSRWSYIVVAFQAFIQATLKGRMDQMLILYFAMQTLKCIGLYKVSLPANAQIVVSQIQKTVDFDMLSLKQFKMITMAIQEKVEGTKFVDRFIRI